MEGKSQKNSSYMELNMNVREFMNLAIRENLGLENFLLWY